MAGKFMATIWAVVGGLLLLAAYLLLGSNIMFAMMVAGLAVACLLVAAACLLKPSSRSLDRATREADGDDASGADSRDRRRGWGPR